MSATDDVENQTTDALLGRDVEEVAARIAGPADLAALREAWAELRPTPVLLEGRADGWDRSWAGLDVRTLVRGEESAGRFAVHSLVLPPGAEFAPHYFDDVHSYVLVTDGEVELGIGASREKAGQLSLGYAPPRTRQSVRNEGVGPATVIVVHSPAGTDRAFDAAHAHWSATGADSVQEYADVFEPYGLHLATGPLENDGRVNSEVPPLDFDLRESGDLDRLRELFESRPAVPRLVTTVPDEFDTSATGATRRKELLNGDVSAGTAMINMLSGVPGMNAPAHHQTTEEEFFFVTGGRLTVTCGRATETVGAGALAFAPRNCTHGFANDGASDARFVTLNSPAGHERALAAMRRVAARNASKDELVDVSKVGGWIIHDHDQLVVPRS